MFIRDMVHHQHMAFLAQDKWVTVGRFVVIPTRDTETPSAISELIETVDYSEFA